MFRRVFAALVLLTAGFIGGLLLTARLHISNDSLADEVRTSSAAPRPAPAPGPAASANAATVVPGIPGPDFTHIAAQAVKGVANISSLQVERRANSPIAADPFFR